MKNHVKKILAIIMTCAVLSGLLSACNAEGKIPKTVENKLNYTLNNEKAQKVLNDNNTSNSVALSQGDRLEIDLEKVESFDTIALWEKGDNCREFKIFAVNDGNEELIYQHDRILKYLPCFLGDISAQKLILEITKSESEVKLCEMSIYQAEKRQEPFKVSQYLRLDVEDFTQLAKNNDQGFSGYYDVVTDVILFGDLWLDTDGSIGFNSGEDGFAKQLSALKQIIGDRDVNIWATVVFDQNNEDGSRNYDKTKDFINNNIDAIKENLKSFVEKYEIDGIDYDWEYPTSRAQWKAYDLIVETTAQVAKVSVAVAPWGVKFSKDAVNAIEHINLMAYDLFDDLGDHSNTYIAGYDAITKVKKSGFKDSQILLGIPTYGRTTNRSEYAWPTIRDDGKDFGEWGNVIENYEYTNAETNEKESCKAYLNSYAQVRDKTALALDNNIGGVMVFRAFCDAPYTDEYSLHRAIGEAISQRTK